MVYTILQWTEQFVSHIHLKPKFKHHRHQKHEWVKAIYELLVSTELGFDVRSLHKSTSQLELLTLRKNRLKTKNRLYL